MKKTLTFLFALMICGLCFGGGLKFTWTGAGDGTSWTDPQNWNVQPYTILPGTATYPGQNNPTDQEDWVIFNNGIPLVISSIPTCTLGRLEVSPYSYNTPTMVSLDGSVDGAMITFVKPTVQLSSLWTVKIDDYCELNCNGFFTQNRVRIVCNPGTFFWQKTGALFYPAEDNNCNGFQGFLLKANVTEHAEFIQQNSTIQPIKAYIEYWLGDNLYHYICPPITSEWPVVNEFINLECRTLNSLCVFDGDYLRKFSNGIGWDNWIGSVGSCFNSFTNIETGRAYEFYGSPYSLTNNYTFYGYLNSSNTVYPIILPITTAGWNFIGNPFASALTFGEPSGATTAGNGWTWNAAYTDPVVYWWDNNMTVYRWYNWYTGEGNGNDLQNLRIIPRSQGFFVHTSIFNPGISGNPSGSDIAVTNEARVFRPSLGIGKSLNTTIAKANTLNLSLADASNNMIDNTRISFREDANTTDFDHMLDVYKFFNDISNVSQLYSKTTDNIDVAMKSLQLVPGTIEYPVYFKVLSSGSYSIIAEGVNSFAPNTGIWLKDNKTNTTVDLKANPIYTFNADVGNDDSRFTLRFSDVVYGIDDQSLNTLKIYSSEKTIIIRNYDHKAANGIINVYDMIGRLMLQGNLNEDEITEFHTGLCQGFYIVTIRTDKGVYNQKVYIK